MRDTVLTVVIANFPNKSSSDMIFYWIYWERRSLVGKKRNRSDTKKSTKCVFTKCRINVKCMRQEKKSLQTQQKCICWYLLLGSSFFSFPFYFFAFLFLFFFIVFFSLFLFYSTKIKWSLIHLIPKLKQDAF